MMVEEEGEGERVAKEGVDPRGELFGDVGASEPPADDVAVVGLDRGVVVGAPGSRFGELADVELVEQPAVDVLGAVVGMEAQNLEGKAVMRASSTGIRKCSVTRGRPQAVGTESLRRPC